MTTNLTRGGLVPAKLINLATNAEIPFMFNPYQYSISKSNSWEKKVVTGQNIPNVAFQQGNPQSLSLNEIIFDTLAENSDVRVKTDKLWALMMIDTNSENPRSGKSAPPMVAFSWGRLYFKGVITSMSQNYTLFNADGVPVRCSVTLTIEQAQDIESNQTQTGGSTSSTQGARNTTQQQQGNRPDNTSQQMTGSPNNQRAVMEENNVDDPLNVPNGTSLRSPR